MPTTESDFSIPPTASHVRTVTVTPGSVKAVATFTMSYQ
jgi:type 1 fimbria pilin